MNKIGKIKSVTFGYGGYQDAMFGISFSLGSDKEHWGVDDFWGTWSREPDATCKWTKQEQDAEWAQTMRALKETMNNAKVSSLEQLRGKPVEVTFEGNILKSWRILTEVI